MLVAKVLAAHPEAAKGYDVSVIVDGARPARVSWSVGGRGADRRTFYAALDANDALVVSERGPSGVAQFIDVLHQQIGLPLDHKVAMPIMGAIALLYCVALVSGTVVLLPSLVSDLFALRVGRNVKRMWLYVHNVLGLFSLPFHLVMALTSVVFAFHDQFYDAQALAFGRGPRVAEEHAAPPQRAPLSPAALVARVREQAPGFTPVTIGYHLDPDHGLEARVGGTGARYGLRGPTSGFAGVDPYTGVIEETDYMPGMQDGWSATITSFFALHFGNFGGAPVRWAYFLLGLAGAMLFYTGNLLWIESRRKKERRAGLPEQTQATRVLGALTVGVPLGCVAGISMTLAAAKLLGGGATPALHSAIYYLVFLASVGWALVRGPARAGVELAIAAAVATLLIPAAVLLRAMIAARRRARHGRRDSVWADAAA